MNCIIKAMLVVFLGSFFGSVFAAERNPNCVMTLYYGESSFAAIGASCNWNAILGDPDMQISVYIRNIPKKIPSVKVAVDCTVTNATINSVSGHKSFLGGGSKVPGTWTYRVDENDHGNILIYVNKDPNNPNQMVGVRCNSRLVGNQ